MLREVVVHPGFHGSLLEDAPRSVLDFEEAVREKIKAGASNIVLLCEPSNIGDTFYTAMDPERVLVTQAGECRLRNLEDALRFSKLVEGATSFLVHGCYLEACAYDLATRLHDALLRERFDGLAAEADYEVWSPIGRFEDASVSFGHVLRDEASTIEADPRVLPFFSLDTFVHLAS